MMTVVMMMQYTQRQNQWETVVNDDDGDDVGVNGAKNDDGRDDDGDGNAVDDNDGDDDGNRW